MNFKTWLLMAIAFVAVAIGYRLNTQPFQPKPQHREAPSEVARPKPTTTDQEHADSIKIKQERAELLMDYKVGGEKAAAKHYQQTMEEAFESSYVPPQGCDKWETREQMVECIDHKLRAKTEFRKQFEQAQAGQIKPDMTNP